MNRRIAYSQVAPEAVKALSATRPYIAASGIEPRLRALVEIRTSQINGCAYCVKIHSHEARQAGETQQPGVKWLDAKARVQNGVRIQIFDIPVRK